MNRFLRDGQKDNLSKQEREEDVTEKDDGAQNGCTASHASGADQENEANEMEVDDAREIVEIPNLPLKDIDLAAISSTLDGEELCPTISTKDQLVHETPATKSDANEKCK